MDLYERVREAYEGYLGKKEIYGKSEEGRALFAFCLGSGRPVGISQYAIHGREFVTALLGLEHLKRGIGRGTVWILPLTNPDGALLSEVGLESAAPWRREFLSEINGGSDFSLWKANADGVDLNVNFDARWGTGKANVFRPASESYVGRAPFCARESAALAAFTRKISPDFTLSWHTKGEEIYWRFHQPLLRTVRDLIRARRLAKYTGYPLRSSGRSAGGYKDWCIEHLRCTAFTVEVGRDDLKHPIGEEALFELVQKNGDALRVLSEAFSGK